MKIASWTAVGGLLLLAFVARAAEAPANERAATADAAPTAQTDATSDASAPGAQGIRAALDPYSRELIEPQMPVEAPGEAGETATNALVPSDFSKTRVEYLPDGRVHIELNGQMRMAAFARIDGEGRATTWCAPNSASATPAPAATPSDERVSKP